MPRSSSPTPIAVTPSIPRRRFSLAEANGSLVYVRRVVADLVSAEERIAFVEDKLQRPMNARQTAECDRLLRGAKERSGDLRDELNNVGCELRDAKTGVIGFAGRHDGREVSLSWRLGEEAIAHFTETGEGYAARQPVTDATE